MHLARVTHNMCPPEEFSSDLLVLQLAIHRTIKTLVQLDRSGGGGIDVVCITLYLIRLRLCAVNVTDFLWGEILVYPWTYLIW